MKNEKQVERKSKGVKREERRAEWEERKSKEIGEEGRVGGEEECVGAMRKVKEEREEGGVGRRGGGFHCDTCTNSSQGGDPISAAGPVDTPSESPLAIAAEVSEWTIYNTWAVI